MTLEQLEIKYAVLKARLSKEEWDEFCEKYMSIHDRIITGFVELEENEFVIKMRD